MHPAGVKNSKAHRDAHGGGSEPVGCSGDHPAPGRVQVEGYVGGSRTGPGTMTATFTVTPADASCRALLLGLTANRASISPRTGAERTVTVKAVAVGDLKVYVYCTYPRLRSDIEPAVFTVRDPACGEALAVTAAGVARRGRWAAGCTSSQRGNAQTPYYARYYTFALAAESDVTVALAPDNDAPAYLDLVPPAGVGVEAQRAEGLDPRISAAGLPAGKYTIETTHRDPRTAGGFAITVTAASAAAAPAAVTVTGLAARHDATVGRLFSLSSFGFEPKEAVPSVKSVTVSGQPAAPSDLPLTPAHLNGTAWAVGTPTRAGVYTVVFAFTQPGREDTRSIIVDVACPDDHTQRSDRTCEPPAVPACTKALGVVVSGVLEGSGSWDSGCTLPAVRRSGGPFYAKHHMFTLAVDAAVTIDVASRHTDAYLFLLKGHGPGGATLRLDNDSGAGRDARLANISLPAGAYTVTATTKDPERVGNFNVRVDAVVPLTLKGLDSSYPATVDELFSDGFTYRPAAAVLAEPSVTPSGLTLTRVDLAGGAGLAGTPTRAGTYTVTLTFTQRAHTDTATFKITAKCPEGKAPSHTGDRTCVPLETMPTGCAATALEDRGRTWWGRLAVRAPFNSYGSAAGAGCTSLSQSGRRAAYWKFSVPSHAAERLYGTIALKPVLASQSRPGQKPPPPPLVGSGGTPSVTLWKLHSGGPAPTGPGRAQRRVQRVASAVARQGADPVITRALPGGDYLIEVAPTQSTVTGGKYELAVTFPTAARVHRDVQNVGNTKPRGDGMDLGDFLDARGSLAKSRSMSPSDPSDPTSPTHPWLAFNADWCSVPSSWQVHLLQAIINSLSPHVRRDLARYIVQQPSFGGVTVPFYYACLRHDFNWRNLHRVKHFFGHDDPSVWNSTVRDDADERFKQDLLVLCNANQDGQPTVPNSWDWTLSRTSLRKCEEVAGKFKLGVETVLFTGINYVH